MKPIAGIFLVFVAALLCTSCCMLELSHLEENADEIGVRYQGVEITEDHIKTIYQKDGYCYVKANAADYELVTPPLFAAHMYPCVKADRYNKLDANDPGKPGYFRLDLAKSFSETNGKREYHALAHTNPYCKNTWIDEKDFDMTSAKIVKNMNIKFVSVSQPPFVAPIDCKKNGWHYAAYPLIVTGAVVDFVFLPVNFIATFFCK